MIQKTGVLLVNLGTPDSPAPRDVYRYLIEFLTDSRVIDTPWLSRQLLVRGAIVPKRYRQSARCYQQIWTPEGSPLKVYGYRLKELLQQRLGDEFAVELAMRYQSPSIESALTKLMDADVGRLIIFPLFPQYASATTGSIHQKVMELISSWQQIPELVMVDHFADHPSLIRAFCATAAPYDLASYDHVLFSFHGLPARQLVKADRNTHCLKSPNCCAQRSTKNYRCYAAQCHATAQGLVKALGLKPGEYSLSFQSRLGKDPWLEPYTSETIASLARQGKKRVLVFCPAFVCDCLETLYEIGMEYAAEFKHAGGECLDLVPGLNDHPQWIESLAEIIQERHAHQGTHDTIASGCHR